MYEIAGTVIVGISVLGTAIIIREFILDLRNNKDK